MISTAKQTSEKAGLLRFRDRLIVDAGQQGLVPAVLLPLVADGLINCLVGFVKQHG